MKPEFKNTKRIFLRKINSFDITKGAGIILMVIGHTECPEILENLIYGFHMPLFFIVAGMLYKKSKWENLGFLPFVQKRAKSYLLPYFILSGVNLILNAINELAEYTTINEWLNSQIYHMGWIIYSSSLSSQNPNCSPLWFLPCLFVACFILYQVMRLSVVGQIGVCVSLFVCNRIIFYIMPEKTTLPWHIDVSLIGVVFMVMGYYINKYQLPKLFGGKINICLLLLGGGCV